MRGRGWWLWLGALGLVSACSSQELGPGAGDGYAPPPGSTEPDGPPPVLRRPPAANPDDTTGGPPYPLVLVHGMGGFEKIGPIDYFSGVAGVLDRSGYEAYFPALDPLNTSEKRGAQLLAYVENVVRVSGKHKVHLIGHSQGGFDIRWVAHARPDLVASVTSIGTPHRGTAVADVVLGVLPGPAEDVVAAIANLYGAAMGQRSDMRSQLVQLSTAGADAFNAVETDAPGVAYYSIAGRTRLAPAGTACDATDSPPFVKRWSSAVDPTDPVMYAPSVVMDQQGAPHDGLVSVPSARWGRFLGCIPADHADEICQILNDPAGIGNSFDCHLFYQELAGWLHATER
jgi:triacylglycerol lipase